MTWLAQELAGWLASFASLAFLVLSCVTFAGLIVAAFVVAGIVS